jgi:hypothetical protein
VDGEVRLSVAQVEGDVLVLREVAAELVTVGRPDLVARLDKMADRLNDELSSAIRRGEVTPSETT